MAFPNGSKSRPMASVWCRANPCAHVLYRFPVVRNEVIVGGPQVTPGFVALFNGKDLTGWKRHPLFSDNWRVENGILIGSAGPRGRARLDTEQIQPKDFHLRVEGPHQ